PVTNNGALILNRGGDLILDNAIGGSGHLVKQHGGLVTLGGINTYEGAMEIVAGTLAFARRESFYNGTPALWTAERFTVRPGAAAAFRMGGPNGFTAADIGLLASVGTDGGGFMDGSTLGLDVTEAVTLAADIGDPNGGGNSLGVGKFGSGTLVLAGDNSYSGPTTIQGGVLTIAGENALPDGTGVSFTGNATLALGATSQTLGSLTVAPGFTGVVTGATGAVTLASGDFRLGVEGSAGNTVLNLAGLDRFTYAVPAGIFQVTAGLNQSASYSSTLNLARNSAITAGQFAVGGTGSANIASTSSTAVEMGQTTTIHADSIKVGLGRNQGSLSFAGGHSNPTLTLRAADGASRVPTLVVGEINSGGQSFTRVSTIDTTIGTLDALVDSMIIGNNNRGLGLDTSNDASFRMGAGLLDANSITLGQDKTGATGTQISSGTLTVNGGTVKVGDLLLGNKVATLVVSGTVNLNGGGVIAARSIAAGAGAATRLFNWNDGIIRTYDAATDLTVSNGIQFTLSGTGARVFHTDSGRTITMSSVMTGTGGLTKTGPGTLIVTSANSHTGTTAVQAGTLGGSGSFSGPVTVEAAATIAPGSAGAGTLATGNLGLAGTYQCQIDGANADRIAVTGNLDLTGASLQVAVLGAPTAGSYVIATYSGTRTGAFASVPSGSAVSYATPGQIVLTVGGGDAYGEWASSKGLTAANNGKNQDPDGDGVSNWLEFYLGGEPLSANSAILPKVVAINATTVTFGFSRLDAAEAAFPVQRFEYGSTLTGWTPVTIGATGGPGPNGIIVNIAEDNAAPDWITVVIPRSLAAGGKLFGRLFLSE
nr:autotransporter-associated beta strand repeat-containing protein [Akkermansiaceae bacterium]